MHSALTLCGIKCITISRFLSFKVKIILVRMDFTQFGITINVPVVFMARYIMVLRCATSLQGALEGVDPENRDFFGP